MGSCVVFWQRMLTPHMTELAREVARTGAEVHYVSEQALSEERRAMGWRAVELSEVTVHFIHGPEDARELVNRLPMHAVHITQGVRANGLIAHAQACITAKRLRHYAVMERVDLRGIGGWVKPLLYAARFGGLAPKTEGLLAIGEGAIEWIQALSPRTLSVIPFAYFLAGGGERPRPRPNGTFRFIFVGGLIARKRIDFLLEGLSGLTDRAFEIEIVGDGPLREALEAKADELLPGRTSFVGVVEMSTAVQRIAAADCLVLPSAHDGWGAVVSEALINGTPAVCSSSCGASGVVRASGFGGVFLSGDLQHLRRCLAAELNRGRVSTADRERLILWARCLNAESGARYLLDIIESAGGAPQICPPWRSPAT